MVQQHGLELGLFFLVGVLAEIHCIGMCGPLITAYAQPGKTDRTNRVRWGDVLRHLVYHGFRIGSYGLLGGLLGFLGGTLVPVDTVGRTFEVFRGAVGLLVGGLIALYGLNYLLRARSSLLLDRFFGRISGPVYRFVRKSFGSSPESNTKASGARGSLHAVLPCPILYPAYLYVFARGSPLFGGLAMILLGAGTIPLLLGYGLFLESGAGDFPPVVHQLLGALLLLFSYATISMGLRILGVTVPVLGLPFYQPF